MQTAKTPIKPSDILVNFDLKEDPSFHPNLNKLTIKVTTARNKESIAINTANIATCSTKITSFNGFNFKTINTLIKVIKTNAWLIRYPEISLSVNSICQASIMPKSKSITVLNDFNLILQLTFYQIFFSSL